MSDPKTVGPLAEEAAALLDAVAVKLAALKTNTAHAAPPAPQASLEGGQHVCLGWCPICRGAELLSGDGTELTERLVNTALLLVTTLRSLIPEQPAATEQSDPAQTGSAKPGVERIDIR